MFPGPVFHYELLTLARRKRFFVLRFGLGMFLLFLVWINDPRTNRYHLSDWNGELSIREAKDLAMTLFGVIATTLTCAVLFLTPALVAGVIADEKQRKTLHYLLSSCLTSTEIVAGKLAARLVLMSVILGLTMPILVLLSLFGGVDPYEVVVFGLCCATTTLLIGCVSVAVSVYAGKPLDAISRVYGCGIFWLVGPSIIQGVMPWAGGVYAMAYDLLKPLNDLVGSSSPFFIFLDSTRKFGGRQTWVNHFVSMAGVQTGFSLIFLVFAIMRLRPVFRSEGDFRRGRFRRIGMRARRFLPRPACGDDAMLWKEMYVSRTAARSKIVGAILFLVVGAFLGYFIYLIGKDALSEVLSYGYGAGAPNSGRQNYNIFLRTSLTILLTCWVLSLATTAASTLAGEREGDTWISLITTPLTPEEILRGKMVGAFWATRWLGFLWALLLLLGLLLGAVHPLGAVFILLLTSAYLWFACAIGTFFSLRATNSSRAMVSSVFTLFVLNGLYLILFIPFRFEGPLLYFGVMPFLEVVSLVTYQETNELLGFGSAYPSPQARSIEIFATGFVSFLAYGTAALGLTIYLLAKFDDIIDRPRTKGQIKPFPDGKAKIESLDAV